MQHWCLYLADNQMNCDLTCLAYTPPPPPIGRRLKHHSSFPVMTILFVFVSNQVEHYDNLIILVYQEERKNGPCIVSL